MLDDRSTLMRSPHILKRVLPKTGKKFMEQINSPTRPGVHAIIAGRSILLRLPRNQSDIAFIRSLGYVRFDNAGFCWVIQHHPLNIKKLNDYFSERIRWCDQPIPDNKKAVSELKIAPHVLMVTRFRNSRIRLAFSYDPAMVRKIKEQPLYAWDQDSKSWTLPHTEQILKRLSDFCSANGWRYNYAEDNTKPERKPRPRPSETINYRKCPEVYIEKMTVLRYSPRTIQVYVDCFTEFLNYFPEKEPFDIKQDEIIGYLRYLIEERCISTSYQNQAINAIKFYFEKVAGGKRETYYIERPRREKFLPEVLSEEEVKLILAHIVNLKHKCMIMTAYSSGLRVGTSGWQTLIQNAC
jgi:integrase/recombinase XerD